MNNYLSLDRYFIEKFFMNIPIINIDDELRVTQKHDFTFGRSKENKNNYKVSLLTEITIDNIPDSKIEAKITGFFNIEEDCKTDDDRDLLLSNGALSTLYGALREYIYSNTLKTTLPPFMLPIYYFNKTTIKFEGDEEKKIK